MREQCYRCGMIANIDPWTHQERYGHVPQVLRDGELYEHNGRGAFVPVVTQEHGE